MTDIDYSPMISGLTMIGTVAIANEVLKSAKKINTKKRTRKRKR